ncbi:hypothetical protein P43SY_002675 [Pythium insidiosum]|uniref:Uncharacterized protein n=1 Tax=Pythium insidiosum TaxID=114742 RepID=A0AAD5MCD3_PYTIN|nr:hypothetical protein P43SY_002675 [Pythium insidiosum]
MSRAPSADATATTRLAAVTMEPKVLERIIALLPMDSACHAIGEATALLQTVAAICRSLPADFGYLVRHIGPENRAFWQGMVLRCFDFTVNSRVTFNVKDHYVTHREYDPDASELLRAAYREWEATHPDDGFGFMMLSESLAYWTHFNVYFHPKQYGFLRKIQYGELGLDAWPDHEDPFTLFCDLALLKDKFPPFRGHMRTHSHDCQTVHPVLLSPYRNEISQADEAFLQYCGFAPAFWPLRTHPISPRWSGFDAAPAGPTTPASDSSAAAVSGVAQGDPDEDSEDDEDDHRVELVKDESPLPHATRGLLDDFQVLVHRYMDDFREVAVNQDLCCSPIFHIGRMKRSGRWLGFIGMCNY